jgi:hypothetical protein
VRAYALATQAHAQLARARPSEALASARQAMAMLQARDGAEEGESLIRLVYVLALEATGSRALAVDHAREAQRRLKERADKIAEPNLRRSFLEKVPENARILALIRSP